MKARALYLPSAWSLAPLCFALVAACESRVDLEPAPLPEDADAAQRSDTTAPTDSGRDAPSLPDAAADGGVDAAEPADTGVDAFVQPGTATDGIRNDDESDVDCGGSRAPRCTIGQLCNAGNDCDNGQCREGRCPNVRYFDINHVLSTGQSNAVANSGTPVLSTTQPYQNKMFTYGVMTSSNCDGDGCRGYETPTSMIPLVEGDQFFNYSVETMSSGFANASTMLAGSVYLAGNPVRTQFDTLVSLQGRSGNTMYCIRRGGCPDWYTGRGYIYAFEGAMRDVQAGVALANAAGKSYAVRAVTLIHGESDHYGYDELYPTRSTAGVANQIRNYGDALIELQQDYEREVRLISGQTVGVPLLLSQMHGWSADTGRMQSAVPIDQYEAHKRAPGQVVLVTPTYMLPFAADGIHFTSQGNRRLGEYFAKAYARQALTDVAWEPLRPDTVTRAGSIVRVKFKVPVPPLVLDTAQVSNPGNYGFEYSDQGAAATPSIVSVELEGGDTVRITLSGAPTNGSRVVRYAYTRPNNTGVGPFAGVRGNLRDSDPSASLYGNALQNWAVTFSEPVP